MTRLSRHRLVAGLAATPALGALALTVVACLAEPAQAPPARRTRAVVVTNGGLTLDNGLNQNGLFQDMAAVALSAQGLAQIPGYQELIGVEAFGTLLKYMVSCALAPDQELTLGSGNDALTFEGGIGLAPEWADGPCEEACQEWVSACLLARTNVYEIPVQIYLTGPHPAFEAEADAGDGGVEDRDGYDMEEGAFYGNLFTDLPHQYACRGAGYDPLYNTLRVCAQPGRRCGMQQVGACGDFDGHASAPSTRHACEEQDAVGNFLRCHNRASVAGSDDFPEPSRTYERVITIFLPKSSFQAGIDQRCEGSLPPAPEPPAMPGLAGALCENDDGCAVDLDLQCDAAGPGGFCTKTCTPDADPAVEAAACGGPGSTCLATNAQIGTCTAACEAAVDGGSCGPARVCTNFKMVFNLNEDAGCVPFCASDADCALGLFCHRSGGCFSKPVDLSLLPDGDPCTFPPGSNDPVVFCRGSCYRPNAADPSQGICGSLVNGAVTSVCPDAPLEEMEPVDIFGDDIAMCALRKCSGDGDCTAPLVCLSQRCQYQP